MDPSCPAGTPRAPPPSAALPDGRSGASAARWNGDGRRPPRSSVGAPEGPPRGKLSWASPGGRRGSRGAPASVATPALAPWSAAPRNRHSRQAHWTAQGPTCSGPRAGPQGWVRYGRTSSGRGERTLLDGPAGTACAHGSGRKIPHDHRAGPHDAEFPDGDARPDKHIGAEPRVFSHDYRPGQERHAPPHVVMGARAKVAVLAYVCPPLERDRGEVIYRHPRSNHRPRREGELPRERHGCRREDDDLAGLRDIRPEELQPPGPETVQGPRAPSEKRRLNGSPQGPHCDFPRGIGDCAPLAEIGLFIGHVPIVDVFPPLRPSKTSGPQGCFY